MARVGVVEIPMVLLLDQAESVGVEMVLAVEMVAMARTGKAAVAVAVGITLDITDGAAMVDQASLSFVISPAL
jgi:hypothetical protein